jgi:hypothetical protein
LKGEQAAEKQKARDDREPSVGTSMVEPEYPGRAAHQVEELAARTNQLCRHRARQPRKKTHAIPTVPAEMCSRPETLV